MMRNLLLCALVLASLTSAADLTGTWRFEQTSPNGRRRVATYVFKAEGNKFTGLVATQSDQRDILNGVIDGNQITFDTKFEFDETGRIASFKGELDGDVLKISAVRQQQGRGPQEMTLKKISSDTTYNPPPELARTHKPFPPFNGIPPNGLAKTPPMA